MWLTLWQLLWEHIFYWRHLLGYSPVESRQTFSEDHCFLQNIWYFSNRKSSSGLFGVLPFYLFHRVLTDTWISIRAQIISKYDLFNFHDQKGPGYSHAHITLKNTVILGLHGLNVVLECRWWSLHFIIWRASLRNKRQSETLSEKASTLQNPMHHINMVTGQMHSNMCAFWSLYLMTLVISFSDRICLNDEAEICSQLPIYLQI